MTPAEQRATERIKEVAQIADVVRGYVKNLRVSGAHLVALCPFHADRNSPSLEVTPTKGLFHCWGCGKAGDVFSFSQAASIHSSGLELLPWMIMPKWRWSPRAYPVAPVTAMRCPG